MAFYRKKRRKAGPSKNDEKVRRAQTAEDNERAAGTLSTRFPSVRSLRVKVSIATPQGVVLEESEETYAPNDAFFLEADCPGCLVLESAMPPCGPTSAADGEPRRTAAGGPSRPKVPLAHGQPIAASQMHGPPDRAR